jgi:hypothetical protein
MTPRSATKCKYLGQEYRIHIRAVLKVLQDTYALNLPGLSVNIWLFKFFGIGLGGRHRRYRISESGCRRGRNELPTSSANTLSEKTITLSPLSS